MGFNLALVEFLDVWFALALVVPTSAAEEWSKKVSNSTYRMHKNTNLSKSVLSGQFIIRICFLIQFALVVLKSLSLFWASH